MVAMYVFAEFYSIHSEHWFSADTLSVVFGDIFSESSILHECFYLKCNSISIFWDYPNRVVAFRLNVNSLEYKFFDARQTNSFTFLAI